MHTVWTVLLENMKCRSKQAVVAIVPLPRVLHVKSKGDVSTPTGFRSPERKPVILEQTETISRNLPKNKCDYTRLSELRKGDPSMSIIEKIVEASMPEDLKNHRKITRVFRVRHPPAILNRFEKHREMVKKIACLQHKSHPRNLVDGNELLTFYGTTISCCSKRKEPNESVSELCSDPHCRICRVLESNFNTELEVKFGIRLSRSSDVTSERATRSSRGKGKSTKRAVIACRAIAGTEGEWNDLTRSVADNNCSEDIIVKNPNAVLPCFVIVFN